MMGKTKDPSLKKDESTTTGKIVVETDIPEESSHDGPEDLNADELASFKKIMGGIEGQEEEQLNGTAKDTGTGEKDGQTLTEDQLTKFNEDIQSISSENRAGVDIPDATNAEATHSENGGDESLDDDQQRAFESIMAQIEGDGAADEADDNEKETDLEAEPEPVDELTAELEKVVRETDAQSGESADDGLDQDQQLSLERIMAQVEGGGMADSGTRSGKKTGEEPESETVDGFSAELEKVVQEADPAEKDEIQDADSIESDDALNGDQQQAFENIMAQIEGGDTEQSEPIPENIESVDPKTEATTEVQDQHSVGPAYDQTDADSEDISNDIDDILAEIASSDDESHLPEAIADDPGSEPAHVKSSEKTIVHDDSVAQKIEDSGLEHAERPRTSTPGGKNGKTTEPVEKPLAKDPSGDQLSANKTIHAGLKSPQKSEPLREATKSIGGRKKKTILASVVAIFFIALAGYFYGIPQRIVDSKTFTPDTDTSRQNVVVETQPVFQVQKPVDVVQHSSDQSRLKTAAENLDRLRNELIEKQAEIRELRTYYQAGIDAEIQGIADRVRNAGKGTIPFKSAIEDPRINLGLSAIQRRDIYIQKLETPLNILFRNSEELLFFSRKAGLLALMAGKTSDIDIDGFIKQADEIRNIHGSALAQLNIDAVPASPLVLESIWQDIKKRLPSTTVNSKNDILVTDTDNPSIWKNICDGDFTQKYKLTELSPDAARCLSTWNGKDLFLNALTELSPEVARHLAAWEGDWLGLNGLNELSPEAAVHLSRWKGKGLSLNGLSRLSPRVLAILSDWQGDQIELVNVKHMAHWENPKTRLFLSEDLERKLKATRK